MSRMQLTDSALEMIVEMSDGNPGAIQALGAIINQSAAIDPQSALGGMGPILSLDTHQIYGADIYVLYSDKCQRNVRKLLVLLRACQLGIMPESLLQSLAADQKREIELTTDEFNELDAKVCEKLEEFQRPTAPAE